MVENIVRYVRILMYWTTHDVVSGTVLLLFSVGKYIFSGRVTYIQGQIFIGLPFFVA